MSHHPATKEDLRQMEARLTALLSAIIGPADLEELQKANRKLKLSRAVLASAVKNAGGLSSASAEPLGITQTQRPSRNRPMPNKTIQDTVDQVEATKTVIGSAKVLINGIAARMQAAVDAALAGGATAADLAPVTDEIASLKTATNELSDAVVANTPADPSARS